MNTATQINGTAQSNNTRARRVKAGRTVEAIDPIITNTPPQHAEAVAKIHARKAKAKAAEPKVEVTETAQASAEALGGAEPIRSTTEAAFDRLNAAYQDVMASFALPTWKRTLVATVLSMLSAFGAGYLIGQVTGMLMIGALAVTGSSFLAWTVFVLGCVVAMYAGMKIAGKVATYVMTEQIDRDIASARDSVVNASRRVAGWLGLGTKIEVAHA